MKKQYEKAIMEIHNFEIEDNITVSGITLNYGGEKGKSQKESFNSLFES